MCYRSGDRRLSRIVFLNSFCYNLNMIKEKTFALEIKGVDEENFIIEAVFSASDEDKHGEIVDQSSWILDQYLKNPVVLFSHDHWQPAIGQTLELGVIDGKLQGKIKFAAKEYDFAKTLFNLYKGKFMRAFSVGFNSLDQEKNEDGKYVLKNNVLLEISGVNLGAQDLALAKSKGLNVDALEKLFEKEGRVLSSKNRKIINEAKEALEAVLAADDKEEDKSADNRGGEKKGRKPRARRVANKFATARILNKAVRSLLREKKRLSS